MIVPNKIISYKKSTLSKIPYILAALKQNIREPKRLWEKEMDRFEDINEYLLALDTLFVLGVIEYLEDERVIKYVETDSMR